MFSVIHDIVYHGNGGFDWHTVYNMPIWLRKFTYKKIADFITKKNEASAPTQSSQGSSRQIDFSAPPSDIKPGQRM
jgi:hypothetical protein